MNFGDITLNLAKVVRCTPAADSNREIPAKQLRP